MNPTLRIIGDVHAQIEQGDLFTRDAQPYLDIIANAAHSVKLGDMGDRATYEQLVAWVDAGRHRFFPGNHDHYHWLPPHHLGDFGAVHWGGVDFFFVRGAWSSDREKLLQLGRVESKTIWFEQEELREQQMHTALGEYLRARPQIVLSHDAPTHVARLVWDHARRLGAPSSKAVYRPSRTTNFLESLLGHHQPRLWLFGQYHRDWRQGGGGPFWVRRRVVLCRYRLRRGCAWQAVHDMAGGSASQGPSRGQPGWTRRFADRVKGQRENQARRCLLAR